MRCRSDGKVRKEIIKETGERNGKDPFAKVEPKCDVLPFAAALAKRPRAGFQRHIVKNMPKYMGRTFLIQAVIGSNPRIITRFLARGANINGTDMEDNTPLMYAVRNSHQFPDIIRLLLDSGANANLKNHKGETALSIAKEMGDFMAVSLLRKHGATE